MSQMIQNKTKCSKCGKSIKGLPAYYEGGELCQYCWGRIKNKSNGKISKFWEKWGINGR